MELFHILKCSFSHCCGQMSAYMSTNHIKFYMIYPSQLIARKQGICYNGKSFLRMFFDISSQVKTA